MRFSVPAALVLLAACALPAHAASKVATDAYEVAAPAKGWKRAPALDPPGRLTWNTSEAKETQAQLRVTFEGAPGEDANHALQRILELEKARVREGERQSQNAERGPFAADSMVVGGLKWVGFRTDIKGSGGRTGAVTRWVAILPDFPRRRRAFMVALDEETAQGARVVPRGADAIAVARSLVPRGKGLGGGIEDAWLDARAAAFAAHLDTTTKLCWRARSADDSSRHPWLGLGKGIALEGDFWQMSDLSPTDSVVDAASAEYGASFDRNGDGKADLVLMNRGIVPVRGGVVLPYAAVLADDDFDGRFDGLVIENGDADGDGRADHRLLVLDTNHDGEPDQAIKFEDSISEKSAKKLKVEGGVVSDRLVGSTAELVDFRSTWRENGSLLAEINRLRVDCGR
jgi:hypothetical protein